MTDKKPDLNGQSTASWIFRDLVCGLVVFLVALPLCLGIALASDAPSLFSGLLAGILGGLVIGALSGSSTSVSGPAAGLAAVVIVQIETLGSFERFLVAVMIAGIIQIVLGVFKAGSLSAFFPSSVIKGLLAAIGVLLILKQIPHLFGQDSDPEGEMALQQPDGHNTFSELLTIFQGEWHQGAAVIGVTCIVLLVVWDRIKLFKTWNIPGPLVVVLLGVFMQLGISRLGGNWLVGSSHLVQIPVPDSFDDFLDEMYFPDFRVLGNVMVYVSGVTIAIVASLETLLNLEAVDKLDPKKRSSPPSRELLAQGVGNVIAGFVGALPMTSVIVRSSVNVATGAHTKLSTIFHGFLLAVCVALFPAYLNMIPLASLAAILIVTGFKLASPKLIMQTWKDGWQQFMPFITTLVCIVATDLLIGTVIGLAISLLFILHANLKRPIRRIVETHRGDEILHIELANQVSFLNRAALRKIFREAHHGAHVLIDASDTDYIDSDVLTLIREFRDDVAPARGVHVRLRGFKKHYDVTSEVEFVDYSTRELQDRMTPMQVLEILREGNRRFHSGHRLTRDFTSQVSATSAGQNPLAVVLSCIDSRVPTELVYDLGIGDVFSVRVAGNVIGPQPLASIEYGVVVSGVKLVVVMGHTRCGAVTSSVELLSKQDEVEATTGCSHLHSIVDEIAHSFDPRGIGSLPEGASAEKERFIDEVAKENVRRSVKEIAQQSSALRQAVEEGRIMIVGAMYDVSSGQIEFMLDDQPAAVASGSSPSGDNA